MFPLPRALKPNLQSKLLTRRLRVIPVIWRALVPYIRDSPLAKNSTLIIQIGWLWCYWYPPTSDLALTSLFSHTFPLLPNSHQVLYPLLQDCSVAATTCLVCMSHIKLLLYYCYQLNCPLAEDIARIDVATHIKETKCKATRIASWLQVARKHIPLAQRTAGWSMCYSLVSVLIMPDLGWPQAPHLTS